MHAVLDLARSSYVLIFLKTQTAANACGTDASRTILLFLDHFVWGKIMLLLLAPSALLPAAKLAPRCRLMPRMALQDNSREVASAAARVHAAAAEFGAAHASAAIDYTSSLLGEPEAAAAATPLMDRTAALFDGPVNQYDKLMTAMNAMQRLVAERSAAEEGTVVGLFRMVAGLEAKIDAAAAEVRQLAAGFGARHARAAVEWTDRVRLGARDPSGRVAPSGNAVAELSNDALLEQRVALFDECKALAGADVVLSERCEASEVGIRTQFVGDARQDEARG